MTGKITKTITTFILLFFIALNSSSTKVRMLINLMDYIAKDYKMAVSNGAIVNEFEYGEMTEFSGNASKFYKELVSSNTIREDYEIVKELDNLQSLIQDKGNVTEVKVSADHVKQAIISLDLVSLVPGSWPNFSNGKSIFEAECASCHGQAGNGQGSAGVGLSPSPTNFTDTDIMQGISPLQAFNTITLGIEGTSMRAFTELSSEEIWDLSFYIMQFQFGTQNDLAGTSKHEIGLEQLAIMSNEELIAENPALDIQKLRTTNPSKNDDHIAIANDLLKASEEALRKGELDRATTSALAAYLKGVEPIEPRIKASDNKLFEELESAMLGVRTLIKSNPNEQEITDGFAKAYTALDEAEVLLIREALEAFFVILAILSILQSVNAKTAIRYVHGGWITALIFGLIGWFFAGYLMNWDAQSRELMEGVIALFAVSVLLYLGFWMHGKSNAIKWKAFVEDRVKGLLSKNNMIGLASFSFLVVFREAFESVIFVSSLTLDGNPDSNIGVLIGAIVSAVVLFGFAWSMLKWFKKMPITKVFLYSTYVVLALAFILAGQGIHAIQEGGYLDISSFPLNIKWTLIGLYPTYETILTQLVVFGLIVLLWKVSARKLVKS
jgi:high-affinity iron transporter